MQPTERLYSNDPYLVDFTASVVKVDGGKVWLDRTAFYPESGGQAGDSGTIDGQKVVDTQFDENKNIVHFLEEMAQVMPGQNINGKLNWERRYRIMRVHAASHIMEHFLFQIFGDLKLLGSHLNEKHDKSTYEYEGSFDPGKIAEVEKLVNGLIDQDIEIKTWPDQRYCQHLVCKDSLSG